MTSAAKWIFACITAASLAAAPLRANDQVATVGDDWAEMMFSERSHDFGSVARGADVRHRIEVTNLYEETITISNVGTTCGCTAAEPSQKTLKTGETAYVEVVMNTVKFMRDKNSNVDVTLTFDNRTFKTVRIPIHAYIRPDVVLEPGRADFGSVEIGQGAEKHIAIAYAGRDDWQITEVASANDYIDAALTETSRGDGRVNYDLSVTVSGDAPAGMIRDQIVLTTNDQGNPKVEVLVEAEVVADIVVSPSTLELGTLTPGDTKTMSVVVRGRRPFSIEKIECESDRDCFKVRLGKDARNVHVLPLTVTAPNESGEFTETFYLTIPGREEPVTFSARGTIATTTAQGN
jgi:hypothetical protein